MKGTIVGGTRREAWSYRKARRIDETAQSRFTNGGYGW